MKATDRTVIFAVVGLVLAVLFYMMILSPKRQEAADLSKQIEDLESSISTQEQTIAFAEDARKQFPTYYGRLVTLGKAVPEDGDQASTLVQLNSLADRSDVEFFGLNLAQGGSGTGTSSPAPAAAPAAPAPATPAPGAEGTTPEGSAPTEGSTATPAAAPADASGGAAAAPTGTAPAPATEASAANLPIGAVVGPAGLPTLPYELSFTGDYFGVAGFIGGVDGLVQLRESSGQVVANGRLMTVDGFSLRGGAPGSDPILDASFLVTSYVTPSEQGLTVGASPGGPAPAPTAPEAVPASSGTVTP